MSTVRRSRRSGQKTGPTPPDAPTAQAILDWQDAAARARWLADLRRYFANHEALTADMLRPLRERELGPVLARDLFDDVRDSIEALFAEAGAP